MCELERGVANNLADQRTGNLTRLRRGPEAAPPRRIAESQHLEASLPTPPPPPRLSLQVAVHVGLRTADVVTPGRFGNTGCAQVWEDWLPRLPLSATPNLRPDFFRINRLDPNKRRPGLSAGILRKAGTPGHGEGSYPRSHAVHTF